jgi:hypothetical protein
MGFKVICVGRQVGDLVQRHQFQLFQFGWREDFGAGENESRPIQLLKHLGVSHASDPSKNVFQFARAKICARARIARGTM